jgi:DNA mismatch repair ATPase MutS
MKRSAFLSKTRNSAGKLEPHIRHIGDLERLMSKTAMGKISPREVMQLRRALMAMEAIKRMLRPYPRFLPWGKGRRGVRLKPLPSPQGRNRGWGR